jgi:2-aminobenzoate-CoA ligase
MLGPSAHLDTFARDRLPPPDQWPDMPLDGFDYPEYLNAAVELTDAMVRKGFGDHTALIGNGRHRTYKELADWTNRIAHALVEDYGVKPGNRVLIRSANNPAMVACWLAATKAGAVVVNTMPMLRAVELTKIVDKAEITLALCDTRSSGLTGPPTTMRNSTVAHSANRSVSMPFVPDATTWHSWGLPPELPVSQRRPRIFIAIC